MKITHLKVKDATSETGVKGKEFWAIREDGMPLGGFFMSIPGIREAGGIREIMTQGPKILTASFERAVEIYNTQGDDAYFDQVSMIFASMPSALILSAEPQMGR